jgi:uncharacterized delta-60 repeat protein/uncharacterized repeat protein (TIGR01451 family)
MGARRLAGSAAAMLLALPAAAHAAPDSPDPGFGSGGTVLTGIAGATPQSTTMMLDGAGRPVVAAKTGATQLGFLRRAPNGAADVAITTSLGTGSDSLPTDVVQDAIGGYVVGGWVDNGGRSFALVRFDGAGAVDAGFGSRAATLVEDGGEIGAIALQGGSIVAAGRSGVGIRVARYAADGTPEFSQFYDYGAVTNEEASGVAVEPSGRILLAGTGVVAGERRFLLAALTPAGAIDTSFGSGGLVTLDVGDGAAAVRALERQPDGKLLVAGTTDAGGAGGGVVARFNPDGTPDAGWSTDGIARLGVTGATVEDVALQPDGKVVAVGDADAGADSIVTRFRPGGARDPGFGSDGVLRRSLGAPGPDGLTGVGIAAGGGIVAGGLASGGTPSVVLTRLIGGDSSDPALAMTAESLGDLVSFTLTATNPGADPAQNVSVTVTPPGGVRAAALATASGACSRTVCQLGTLPAGATRRMTLFARARRPGALSASARITGATFDANPGNNSASATGRAGRNRGRRDRIAPRVVMTLKAKRVRQVRKRVKVAVRTSEAATVVVWSRYRKGGKTRTLTRSRTVKLRKAGTKTVKLKLKKAARKVVGRKKTRRLKLRVHARARDRAGNSRTKTLRRTLRR